MNLSSGEFMRLMRERAGLTQRELGKIIGKSDQAVSDWERGQSVPSLTPPTMKLLCEALGITFDELADHFIAQQRR